MSESAFHPRPLIFLHIPKAAGTTLEAFICSQYPAARWFRFTGDVENFREFRGMSAAERGAIDLFTGHVRFGVHAWLDEAATYVTMLRDPVERVVSYYYYILRSPEHYLHATLRASGLNLHEFVRTRFCFEIDNDQVRWLNCMPHVEVAPGRVTRQMLEEAKVNLATRIACFGLAERFHESIELLRHQLGWTNGSVERRNATADRPRLDQVPQATISLIRETNALDVELYEFAAATFQDRLDAAGLGARDTVASSAER
ncbi:MAG: sulfotransferase family 2 domain-containing protein [Phycisphaerales bacterium]